ncbi:hypothetical protein D1AOALGA4SA_2182 [Olavius algarvensis Delta 1 endosymbiont]|nr:hypothetical protein D1AOALGA4SA_2182 [Olavius algarvensis Delta 1 endosymbiont]
MAIVTRHPGLSNRQVADMNIRVSGVRCQVSELNRCARTI